MHPGKPCWPGLHLPNFTVFYISNTLYQAHVLLFNSAQSQSSVLWFITVPFNVDQSNRGA
jgi:hypothetical protein